MWLLTMDHFPIIYARFTERAKNSYVKTKNSFHQKVICDKHFHLEHIIIYFSYFLYHQIDVGYLDEIQHEVSGNL